MDVSLVPWPRETDLRDRLANEGRPRLLLVEPGASAPVVVDPLEDWVQVPATDAEVRTRMATLRVRSAGPNVSLPVLDDNGVLRHRGDWTSLPPVEARIARVLLDRLGAVVSRDALARAGWPEGAPGRNALDVHVLRLRRRLTPVGLAIRTVRSRGYLLEVVSAGLAREA
jgi:DNA-binding response OmpR family regulator